MCPKVCPRLQRVLCNRLACSLLRLRQGVPKCVPFLGFLCPLWFLRLCNRHSYKQLQRCGGVPPLRPQQLCLWLRRPPDCRGCCVVSLWICHTPSQTFGGLLWPVLVPDTRLLRSRAGSSLLPTILHTQRGCWCSCSIPSAGRLAAAEHNRCRS